MKRTAPLLLLVALGIAAEGAPATPPAEQPLRRAGARVARVTSDVPTWDGRVRLGAGWDSNALLDSDPDTVQTKTALYSAESQLGWRPIADDRNFVKATGTVAFDRRPQLERLDSGRLALGVSGARQGEVVTTGGSLSAARYWLDGDGAAAEVRGGASLAWLRQDSVDLLALEAAVIHFDVASDRPEAARALGELGRADDRSGAMAAGAWRHWWQLGGGSRLEAAVRGGRFFANDTIECYELVQPWLALRLRSKGWDVQARAAMEGRLYDAERVDGSGKETSVLSTMTVSADRLLRRNLWAGAYVGASARDSDYDSRDYERWQIGARLTWTFAAAEE